MAKKEPKIDFELVGKLSWTEMRELVITQLNDCKTPAQLNECLGMLFLSMGTKEEIIARRKRMGMDTKDLEELKDGD